MRREKRNLSLITLLCFSWMVCTALFIFAGYCITGAIPVINIEISYLDRLLMVISSPFEGYFNEYTPIGMIGGFILCEIIFVIILCMMNQLKQNTSALEEMKTYLGQSENDSDTEYIFPSKVQKKNPEKESVKEQKSKKASEQETEVNLMLQEQTFLELFGNGYSMHQITEMMELTKYIKKLDVLSLKKMFKPTMSPEDIRRYIESFYG